MQAGERKSGLIRSGAVSLEKLRHPFLCEPAKIQEPNPAAAYDAFRSIDAPLFPKWSGPGDLYNTQTKIKARSEPYPYYVQDKLLTDAGFAELLANWPDSAAFTQNTGYNRNSLLMQSGKSWEVLSKAQQQFWRRFIATVCPSTIRESLWRFAPAIATKYSTACPKMLLGNFEIIELSDSQLPIPVHTHHYHSPLCVASCVFYIDDNNHTVRGTSIYRAKGGHDSVEDLAQLASAQDGIDKSSAIERCDTVDFAPNRAFIMHDSPISWHKVEDNSVLGDIGPRKHLLFSWGLSPEHMHEHYGVDVDTYRNVHAKEQGSDRVKEWAEKDIRLLKAPCNISADALRAFADSIAIEGYAALDLF